MVYVTGLPDHRVAIVIVLHHLVADDIGGLEVLARLVDGVPCVRTDVGSATAPDALGAVRRRWHGAQHRPDEGAGVDVLLRRMSRHCGPFVPGHDHG